MKIKSFEIVGLSSKDLTPVSRDLHQDLNIVTGRNGSGKTTLLKLLWYIISGNIEHAIREVPFSKASVETDEYSITITKRGQLIEEAVIIVDGKRRYFADAVDADGDTIVDAEEQANDAVKRFGSSVFFPTFRRIEGGFSLVSGQKRTVLS